MGQHQTRTGPVVNDAAAITVDMLQGCLPAERSHGRLGRLPSSFGVPEPPPFTFESTMGWHPDTGRLPRNTRSAMFGVPDVDAFPFESVIGWHPDTARLLRAQRGPSFFPWSGTEAPFSPEMVVGCAPDRPMRWTVRYQTMTMTPDVAVFSIEMAIGHHPDSPRIRLGPKIPLPVSQTTHVAAPFSVEMAQGSVPPTKRYLAPVHDGWQWITPEGALFSIEMVIGSHPDSPRLLLASRLGLPVGETATIDTPIVVTTPDATGGWIGGDATPGYRPEPKAPSGPKTPSQSWLTREYRRQPGQRPTKRAKTVPVMPEPRPDVAPQPRALPVLVRVEGVGGIGGVGTVQARVGMMVASASARGMVVQAFSVKPARKALTADEWAAVNLALSDD